jgi:amino acid transporter
LAIVFVESIYSAAGTTDQADRWEHKLLSVGVLAVITVANSISTKASTRLNNFFVVTKLVTIAAVVVAGVGVIIAQLVHKDREDIGGRDWYTHPWFGYRETVAPGGEKVDWKNLGTWNMFGHYSAALYGALWGYSGWDKVSFLPRTRPLTSI